MEIQTGEVLKSLLGGYELKKELKSTVKADGKSISEKIKEDIKSQSSKTLLENLFKDLSNDKISKDEVLKLLQNSILQKSSKSISNDLKEIISQLKKSKISTNRINLDKLLLDIKDLNSDNFKKELEKSGLYLESKLAKSGEKELNLTHTLKEVLKDIATSKIVDSNIKEKLQTLSLETKVSKTFFDTLQEIASKLTGKGLSAQIAKLDNLSTKLEIVSQQIDNFKTKVKDDFILKLAEDITKGTVGKDVKRDFLNGLLSEENLKNSNISKKADFLLNKNVAKEVFENGVKSLAKEILNDGKIDLLKARNDFEYFTNEIKKSLQSAEFKDFNKDVAKEIGNLSLHVSNLDNMVVKDFLKLDIPTKLQRVANLLKQELDLNDQIEIKKSILGEKLESILKESVKNGELKQNQPLEITKDLKNELIKDIKSQLLISKDEIQKQELTPLQRENLSIQIDKVLSKIEYFQLLSYSSETNVSYLPLLWDGLEEGEVSIKKLKQNRFFCEIKLKLKKFGDIEFMVMLHDNVYINISVFAKNNYFLNLARNFKDELKRGISSVGLICENIYFYDTLRDEKIRRDTKDFVLNNQTGKGIDLQI